MTCMYASKLKLPVAFLKINWNLHPAALKRQLNYLKCFVTMSLWQSNNLGIILCYQSFLLHCLSLTCWSLLPFLESIWISILIKLLCNFIKIALRHECSPVNFLHVFRTPFPSNTSGWLLLDTQLQEICFITFFILVFYEIFIKFRSISYFKIFTKSFWVA